jgi:uncharacterized membrane protein
MMDKTLLHRFIRSRPYLTAAILLGIIVGLAWPDSETWLRRALIGWDAGVWTYLVGMSLLMTRADHHRVRELACRQDENAGTVLFAMVVGAMLSLYAIVSELAHTGGGQDSHAALRYAFTALTVVGSWLLVGVMFCLHYAHLYYRAHAERRPLRFPDADLEPNYWDFLYFSFTIAVAVQTSDVTVMSRPMRQLVLGQSVLAFFFNLAILGLSINIAASLVNA